MEPLAHRLRPTSLQQICGQQHLIGSGKILSRFVEKKTLSSLIFYGPPGVGKTTLAMVLAQELQRPYRFFNATQGNKKDLEQIFTEAKFYPGMVLIMDEVHRLNKDKQDLLLPHLEDGSITLLGATTANPLFAINPAIRSRTHLIELKALQESDILQTLARALHDAQGYGDVYVAEEALLQRIARQSNGDVRYALNMLELAVTLSEETILRNALFDGYAQIPNLQSDANESGHYDLLSAFQKSIRGSDVDAALLYLASLLTIDDFPSLERRLLVIAYEDIGLANPHAVARTLSALDAAKRVGMPEARIILANSVIELALSPKSKSAQHAIDAAMACVQSVPYQIPDYLRYTPVALEEADKYDYDLPASWDKIQYLPDRLAQLSFYEPQSSSQNEQVLANNLKKLKAHPRTNQLARLKQWLKNQKKAT